MSSSEYPTIDFETVTAVRFTSQSDSTDTTSTSSTDPDREAAQSAHPSAFQKFVTLYDALIEAIEQKDRERVFEVLGTPSPYSGSNNRPRFSSAFKESLPDRFYSNLEDHDEPRYSFDSLFTGVSWGGNYKYSSASMFALRVAWLMCIPMDAPEVQEYHDLRAEAHLRDLGSEYAPAASGARGNHLEDVVRNVVDWCGLPLGPRNFRIETTDGVKNRELDINTEVGGDPVIIEVFTSPSSYYNKDDQVRDYAKLYARTEIGGGEVPHVFHVTDTRESVVSVGVLESLLSESTDEVTTVPRESRESDEEPFELARGVDGYGELPEAVRSEERRIEAVLDECGLSWSRPRLSMTVTKNSRSLYGGTRSSTETRHIQLGPTITVGPSWQSLTLAFLSDKRSDEQILPSYQAGREASDGSVVYPVVVSDDSAYVRGESITTLKPNVLYGLLQAGVEEYSLL